MIGLLSTVWTYGIFSYTVLNQLLQTIIPISGVPRSNKSLPYLHYWSKGEQRVHLHAGRRPEASSSNYVILVNNDSWRETQCSSSHDDSRYSKVLSLLGNCWPMRQNIKRGVLMVDRHRCNPLYRTKTFFRGLYTSGNF